jgi:hypothetical protein
MLQCINYWLFNKKMTFKEKRLKVINKKIAQSFDYKEIVRLTHLYNKVSGKKDDYLSTFKNLNNYLNSNEKNEL